MWPTAGAPAAQSQSQPGATVTPSGGGASASGAAVNSGGGAGGYFPSPTPATTPQSQPQQAQAPVQGQQPSQPSTPQGGQQQSPGGAPAYNPNMSLRDNLNAAVGAGQPQQPFQQPGMQPQPFQVGQPGQQQQAPIEQRYAELQSQFDAMRQQQAESAQWAAYGQYQWYQAQQARQAGGQQQPGQTAQSVAPKSVFGIPQFDQGLLQFMKEDGTFGPGAPPTAAYEYRQWQDARRKALDGFLNDPMQALWPAIEERMRGLVPQMAQQQMTQQAIGQHVNTFIQQNSDWLYQQDGRGGVARNPITGAPQLSQWGQMFHDHVGFLQQSGITDPRVQQKLAQDHVLLQITLAQQQQQQAQAAQAQSQQGRANLLNGQAPAQAPAGPFTMPQVATPPSAATPAGTPQFQDGLNHRMSLRSAMTRQAQAAGLMPPAMSGMAG